MSQSDNLFHWFVGIFEGEGTIINNRGYLRLSITSVDRDVIIRVRDIIGGMVRGPLKTSYNGKRCQDVYRWEISGGKSITLLRKMMPLLGTRRHSKAIEVLSVVRIKEHPNHDQAELIINFDQLAS